MTIFPRLRSWLRAGTRRARMEDEMSSELAFHMERYEEDLRAKGISPAEARRRARVEFGAVEARKEECREALGLRIVDELRSDIRYAFRMLRQAPAFTAVAILSLALGIGANTAIFTLMETALWKSIPVKNPEQLRLFSWVSGPKSIVQNSWGNWDESGGVVTSTSFSYPVFQALRQHNAVLENVFAFKPIGRVTALIDGQVELVNGNFVSGNFFEGVGVSTIAGRPIVASDDTENAAGSVAVISYGYWNRRFGRDASTIGRSITINQIPVTIIGVNPPAFTGVTPGESPDVFLPISIQPVLLPAQYSDKRSLLDDPDFWWVLIMGRLKPNVSETQARSALDLAMLQKVRATVPSGPNRDLPRLRFLTGSRGLDDLRGTFGKPLLVLMALVGLVLLIACANLANLLLARATSREREISVRLALGAGRWRISRQMLTEGIVLAMLGGTAGLLLGYWARNGIPSLMANAWRPSSFQADFDARVLTISFLLTLLTGILFSLAPAWQATRAEVNTALKDGARSTRSLPKLLAAKGLVVFQICLSLLLLVGAGLFIRTLSNLQGANLGFRPQRVLLFDINPPRTRYAGEHRKALFQQLEERIAVIPGLQSSSLSREALVADSQSTTRATPSGREPGPEDRVWVNDVGDRFFETMGIPILYGRSIGVQDRANSPTITVVNQTFVKKFFPNQNPLGRTVVSSRTTYQIVGVSGDARYNTIRGQVPPTFYRVYKQQKDVGSMTFEVKTAASEASVVGAIREAVRSVDKDLPVYDVRTQTEQIDATLSNERVFAALATGFGLLALILACVGIYGVMAYAVARRTGEIGLRMALGAQGREVLSMILREAAILAAAGVAVGLLAAIGLTRYLESILFGLKPSDPLTLGMAVLIMISVALLAGWLPARKASRLDPMSALRHE